MRHLRALWTLYTAPLSVMTSGTDGSSPEETFLFAPLADPVTVRWDEQAQRILDTYGDSDGDGLSDAEELSGLGLYDVKPDHPLHAFGPAARLLNFPTPADTECRLLRLPFAFPFGDGSYTQAFVHVDGVLGFG